MDPSKNPTDPNRTTVASPSPNASATGPNSKSPSSVISTPTNPNSNVDVSLASHRDRRTSIPAMTSLPSAESAGGFLTQMNDDVFSTPEERSDMARFNMALVHGQGETPESKSRFDERDYQSHRRESFPHPHQPLKPIRSMRKKSTARPPPSLEVERSDPKSIPASSRSTGGKVHAASGANYSHSHKPPPPPTPITGDMDNFDEELDRNSLLNAVVSSFPYSGVSPQDYSFTSGIFDDMMEPYSKKVQFEVGGSPFQSGPEEEIAEKKKHKFHRSQRYEDPQWRLRLGSEMLEDSSDIPLLLRDPDTSEMADLDKDDLTSHRFGDAKGFRRHKFYIREPELITTNLGMRIAKYDHQPHEIYVELDILSGAGDEREWKETARWIKYEEDVEEGADRWGRPHVASLSFHSLINLRKLIEAGVVLLDLEERDLPGVAYRVVDQMVLNELVQPENKGFVMRSLLLKHKHVNDSAKTWQFNLKRNAGSVTSLHNMFDERNRGKNINVVASNEPTLVQRRNSATVGGSRGLEQGLTNGRRNGSASGAYLLPDNAHLQQRQHTAIDLSKLSLAHLSEEDVRWMSNKESILRRIPVGSEASVVLVGVDDNLEVPAMAFVRLAESVYMPNITEVPIPVRFIFILLGPSTYDLDYKEVGRSIATLMSNREFHDIAYKADDRKDLLKGIHEYLDESVVLPPGEYEKELFPFDDLKEKNEAFKLRKQRMSISAKGAGGFGSPGIGGADGGDDFDGMKKLQGTKASQSEPLKRTRRCFGGLVQDVRRRYPLYLSDIKDGMNFQCVAAIVFIAFAQICGSIAFGGLMGSKTHQHIGISETLMSSALGGLLFSIFAAQPLLIVGTSGPLLLFDESLYTFCEMNGIDFLSMRTWIGFWLAVIGLVFVGFEASVLVRFFTRFTQEIFSALVSLLFIAESMLNLKAIYDSHPLVRTYGSCKPIDPLNASGGYYVYYEDPLSKDPPQKPNTALLSTMLMFGTFGVAWFFRAFRNSTFLTLSIRKILGNFAVPIAIGSLVLIDYLISETETKKLDVPEGIQPSMQRPWFVDPSVVKSWGPAVAILPSMLLFILLFMEVSIGELIVSKSDNKLVKGPGFHLDILLICLINTLACFFGLAWISVALVRAVAHVSALTVWSTNNPPGEKPKIIGVKEQRISALIVSIFTFVSILASKVLSIIPMAVLFGVFLYMGISSMSGIQFFERMFLFCKQVANHPQVPYVRRVRTLKMHLFTIIQIFWLAILWGVKYTQAALSFPFILVILIPFRFHVLRLMFSPEELSALDSSGEEKKEQHVQVEPAPPSGRLIDSKNRFSPVMEEKVQIDPLSKPLVENNGTSMPKNSKNLTSYLSNGKQHLKISFDRISTLRK